MGNLFDAHIFKRRSIGEREEVKLKMFNLDGSPLEVGGGEPAPDPTAMHFRGAWASGEDYNPSDVVLESGSVWVSTDTIENSQVTPTNNNTTDTAPMPVSAGHPGAALRIHEGLNSVPSADQVNTFFEVQVAGTITISSNHGGQYHTIYYPDGSIIQEQHGVGIPVVADVVPGRYFVHSETGTSGAGNQITVALSNGAVLVVPAAPVWTKLAS